MSVPTASDLFYNGTFTKGGSCKSYCQLLNTFIVLKTSNYMEVIATSSNLDVRSYSTLKITGYFYPEGSVPTTFHSYIAQPSGARIDGSARVDPTVSTKPLTTYSIDISQATTFPANSYLSISMVEPPNTGETYSTLTRISRIQLV